MDLPSPYKSGWTLGEEAFRKFLARLDPDPARAGVEYERLRMMLLKFFDWRGAHFPEDCVDETLNRVIRKLDRDESIEEVFSYCHGIARLVFLESRKRREVSQAEVVDRLPGTAFRVDNERDEERMECFEQCLDELSLESRQLIFQYYSEDKRKKIDNRKELAESLGIPSNALRSRAQRIRKRLEECIEHCSKS
jgi:RNA polymerase sigma factor (sigma-70 family)